jgi:transposase-like protein
MNMHYEPTCPLCHGSLVLFDRPIGKDLEDYPRYLCKRCRKFISIEPADEMCEVMGP